MTVFGEKMQEYMDWLSSVVGQAELQKRIDEKQAGGVSGSAARASAALELLKERAPVTDEILRRVLRYAEEAGIRFFVGVEEIDADQAVDYINDPEQAEADWEGVTVEQLRRYNERNGIPQCGAITKNGKGRRCKCTPTHTYCYGAKAFVELDGDYCSYHGGLTRAEERERLGLTKW